jgi:hypothetical protein
VVNKIPEYIWVEGRVMGYFMESDICIGELVTCFFTKIGVKNTSLQFIVGNGFSPIFYHGIVIVFEYGISIYIVNIGDKTPH